MSTYLALIAFAGLGCVALATYRSLARNNAPLRWHAAFYLLMLLGASLGFYCGFYFNYLASPTIRVFSFPIPAAFHVLESTNDGTQQWVDFVTPFPLLCAAANVAIFAGLAVLPLSLSCLFRRIPKA